MNVAVISGSHRKGSNSIQAARWVAERLSAVHCEPALFDLSSIGLPFWSEDNWRDDSLAAQEWKPYSRQLQNCDAVVIICPEWAGMAPPKLINFLLLCSSQELAYKPCLLIAVSAGTSGTYPIAQLRMSASKNNQMIFLPDHLIVRNAGTFFSSDAQSGNVHDEQSHLNQRLNHNIRILRAMAVDLKALRPRIDLKKYSYGL